MLDVFPKLSVLFFLNLIINLFILVIFPDRLQPTRIVGSLARFLPEAVVSLV